MSHAVILVTVPSRSLRARGLPARIKWRMRNRLKANTPASMPDSRTESALHRMNKERSRVFIGRTQTGPGNPIDRLESLVP